MDDPQVPKKLIDALRSMHAYTPAVPQAVDSSILGRARRRLRTRPLVLRWVAAGAVAAAGLIAFVASRWVEDAHHEHATPPSARVTILDAFSLARRIDAKTPRPEDDVNGDGRVDRLDVDHVAMLAVTLPPRTGGGK